VVLVAGLTGKQFKSLISSISQHLDSQKYHLTVCNSLFAKHATKMGLVHGLVYSKTLSNSYSAHIMTLRMILTSFIHLHGGLNSLLFMLMSFLFCSLGFSSVSMPR
jgi:hypothetical protein